MAKNGAAHGYAQPGFSLRLCFFCGMPAQWKIDKKGRPYHSCGFCQTKLFVYGTTAHCAMEMLQELVIRFGVQRFRRVLNSRVQKRASRAPVPK
jgi:hypothetical protein